MPRLLGGFSNVIVVPAGQLPAQGQPWWYSDRGNQAPGGAPGGQGGTPQEGYGLPAAGTSANTFTLYVLIDQWDPLTTGLELCVETNTSVSVASGEPWAPAVTLETPDGVHHTPKPWLAQILKSDFPVPGVPVPIAFGGAGERLRFGVRALDGNANGTSLHADIEFSRGED